MQVMTYYEVEKQNPFLGNVLQGGGGTLSTKRKAGTAFGCTGGPPKASKLN